MSGAQGLSPGALGQPSRPPSRGPQLSHPGIGRSAASPRDRQLLKKTNSRHEPKSHLERVTRRKAFPSPGPGGSRGEPAPTLSRPEALSVPGVDVSRAQPDACLSSPRTSSPLRSGAGQASAGRKPAAPCASPTGRTERPLLEDWAPSWAGSRGTVRASCGSSLLSPPLPSPPRPAPNCK